MTTIHLPPLPRVAPGLTCDPAAISTCGADLLAASAQVDDLGSFVAGAARVGDWTGDASTAYHEAIVLRLEMEANCRTLDENALSAPTQASMKVMLLVVFSRSTPLIVAPPKAE